jgi:hypothetical protein
MHVSDVFPAAMVGFVRMVQRFDAITGKSVDFVRAMPIDDQLRRRVVAYVHLMPIGAGDRARRPPTGPGASLRFPIPRPWSLGAQATEVRPQPECIRQGKALMVPASVRECGNLSATATFLTRRLGP